ncbi:MAG: hypothetical protein OEV28_00165 [Nitrospirota bacterium]|nr:hypothetical protein [Nitrospirota bacterium]
MKYLGNLLLLSLPFFAACAALDAPDQPSVDPAPIQASKNQKLSFQDRLEMAEAYDRHGLSDKAYEEYKTALSLEPDNEKVLVALVRNASNTTRYEEAETYCRRALELNPRQQEMLYYQGWLSVKLREDYGAAQASIDRAIEMATLKKPFFMQTKGLFLVEEGRNEEAAAIFRAAITEADRTQMPDKERAYLKLSLYKNLGRALRKMGREDEAQEALTHAYGIANSLGVSSID